MGKNSLLGVDISSTCIRVVRSEGLDANGSLKVSGVSMVALPDGAVYNGRIQSTGVVGAALKQAVNELKASKVPAVLGISDPDAGTSRLRVSSSIPATKRISYLRTKGVRILDTVMTSEGKISLYNMGNHTDSDGNEFSTVMTAIAPEAEIDKLRQVASVAGIKVKRIDLLAAATVRATVRDFPGSRAVRAVVDVGATTTRVIVVEGLHVQEIRTISAGGNDLTQAIAAAVGSSVTEAEATKWGLRLTSDSLSTSYGNEDFGFEDEKDIPDHDKALAALSTALDDLVEQIAQALAASSGVADINDIFVVGGTALLRGFLQRLQRRTGKKPLLASPWAVPVKNKNTEPLFMGSVDGAPNEKLMLAFLTACGLATPTVGDKK